MYILYSSKWINMDPYIDYLGFASLVYRDFFINQQQ